MEKEIYRKDPSNRFIKNLDIGVRLTTTLFTLALAYETVIYMAEPVARVIAIPILNHLANENEPVNPEYSPLHVQIESAVEAAQSHGIHITYNRMPDAANLSDFV